MIERRITMRDVQKATQKGRVSETPKIKHDSFFMVLS